jgi:uncharacterized protein
MKPRQFLPQKLDIKAFIESQMPMDGASPLSELPRLGDSLSPEISLDTVPPIPWRAQGRLVPQRVGAPQLWLDLSAHAELPWSCQRCLHPVNLPVSFDRQIHFVADEAVAAELDAELDEDVLVLSRSFDLLSLIEDELIMASPLVPRHDSCPVEPVMAVSDPGVDGDDESSDVDGSTGDQGEAQEGDAPRSKRPNPFAVLAKLKKGGSDQGGDA